jgi:hypothetical protein
MSHDRLPPPCPPQCLYRPYPSSQKGGTLIAEEVTEPAAHHRRLCDPDGYRPPQCPRCGHHVLHVHGYRERRLPGEGVVRIVIHRCIAQRCQATWRILPLFLARWLWRTWRTVEQQVFGERGASAGPAIPGRTVRRWKARLAGCARGVLQVLSSAGSTQWSGVAQAVGAQGSRGELVQQLAAQQGIAAGSRLAMAAALLHRLCPGVRLM